MGTNSEASKRRWAITAPRARFVEMKVQVGLFDADMLWIDGFQCEVKLWN
jgi:hypothetical protein